MPCAYTGQAARNDLAALGDKTLQQANVAVRDGVDLLGAELTDLLAPEKLAATRSATRSAGRPWSAGSCARTGVPGVTGASGVPAAGAGCRCVMFSRMRAGFVSHNISHFLSGTLCLPPLQTRVGVSEHSTGSVEWKRYSAIRDALCDAVAIIANTLERMRED
jgi:hypothetical protein